MKILQLFFVMATIQIVYFLFYLPNITTDAQGIFGTGFSNYSGLQANVTNFGTPQNFSQNYTEVPISGYTSLDFWSSFLTPSLGTYTRLFAFFVGLALFVFFFGLYASRNEMVYLAPIFIIFIGVGIIPTISLYNMINSDVAHFACQVSASETATSCLISSLAGIMTAGILYLMWLLSCVEWWSARTTA